MDQFIELYGFVAILLHAAGLIARSVLAGSTVYLALLAAPLGRIQPDECGARLIVPARGWILGSAAVTVAVALAGAALQAATLASTLELPLGVALTARVNLVTAGIAACALAIAALAAPRRLPSPGRCAALCLAAFALLLFSTATTHAVAREEGRGLLFAATLLHQVGAALWLGGLPPFLAALRLDPVLAQRVGGLYSRQAAFGVGLILLGILGFWNGYLATPDALYGTAYGAMASTKAILLLALLGLGAGNFALLHGFAGAPAGEVPLLRVRRFVECEIAIGIAVLATAASITSLPPAMDLPEDRASWAAVVERFTPQAPRLSSPDQADLGIPALQTQLDAEWRQRQAAQRPQAYVPGEGELPPRNAADIAWSEYNHNWSGLVVLLVGLAALLDATGRVPLARHWPLLFLGLAAFILVRADPEAWPLGEIGFLDSLRDPGVVQHKLAGLLVVAFALAEWAVRLGRLGGRIRFVLPVAMLAGGVLLLMHSHSFADPTEGLLVELSHLAIGVLAVFAGCARWVELRGPAGLARRAGAVWPVCLILVGILLLIYREA